MNKFIVGVVYVLSFSLTGSSFLPSAWAVNRTLEVVLVRTAETNGSKAPTLTAEGFLDQVQKANAVYASAGIQFKFDPVKNFPPIVNDSVLNNDWILANGQSLYQPADKQPELNGIPFATAKNNYATKNYPNKLVVYAGQGQDIKFDTALGRWTVVPRKFAYSSSVDRFIQWVDYDVGGHLFAHEVGHYLHLWHTFGPEVKNKVEFESILNKALKEWGYTFSNLMDLFNGDAGTVTDTPSDVGPALWAELTGDACGGTDSVSYEFKTLLGKVNYTLAPDRRNVMSYFKDCPFPEGFHISAQQAVRAKEGVEWGNRQNLIYSNPSNWLNPNYSFDLKAVSWSAGRLDLFVSGADASTRHKAWSPTEGWVPAMNPGWEFWDDMGGRIIGKPTAVAWGPNRLDLFVRGTNSEYFHKAWDGANWYPNQKGWTSLGGSFASSPVAISWGANRLDILGRGYNGNVYHKAWSPQTGWSPSLTGWNDLGKMGNGEITAVSWGPNRIDIFGRTDSGEVLTKSWNGQGWYPSMTEWVSLGGKIKGSPAVTAWSANRLDIAVRGMDDQIYLKSWTGTNWYPSLTGWSALGGALSSDPVITSWGPGRLDIAARGMDSAVYLKSYQEGSGWYPSVDGWSSLGGYLLPGTRPEMVSWGPGRLDIFIRNTNFMIQHKAYENAWYPSQSGWNDLGKYID